MRNKRLLSLLISASLIVGQMGLTGVYAAETTGDEVVTYEEAGFEKPAEVAEDETDAAVNDEVTEQEKSEEAENDANSNDPNAVTEYLPEPTAPDFAHNRVRVMADGEGEEVKKADIAFVIDTTGSMSGAIRSVSMNLSYFIDILETKGIDLHMSVIDYRDIFVDGPDSTVIHHYPSGDSVSRDDADDTDPYYKKNKYTVSEGNIWTVSGGDVKDDLDYLSHHVNGGGDTPETPTDALQKLTAADYGWREDAHKFAFLLTDAGYKVSANSYDYYRKTLSENILPDADAMASILRSNDIKTTVVSHRSYEDDYEPLYRLTGGKFIDISSKDWYLTMVKIAGWIVSGTSDRDGDGLLDEWEIHGMTKEKDGVDLDLPGMGADPDVPDVFVEVDYFEDTENGISLKPDRSALRTVYQSFKDHGINLHIDAGFDSVDYVTGKIWGDKSGSGAIAKYSTDYDSDVAVNFKKAFPLGYNYSNWNRLALDNFDKNRWNTFRYCVFMNDWATGSSTVGTGSSGIAEDIPGQFFIVADTGDVSGNRLSGGLSDLGSTAIAGTFMHELGHTLGLSHGGVDTDSMVKDHTQYKSNYLSVMNYLFQFSGLVGSNEVNYSDWKLPALDEAALVESDGFDPAGITVSHNLGTKYYDAKTGKAVAVESIAKKAVDLDGDGDTNGTVSIDLNNDSNISVLKSSGSDWDNIVFMGGLVGGLGEEVDAAKENVLKKNDKVADSLENEIPLDDAIAADLTVNPGTCTIGTVLPSKAFTGLNGQTLSISLNSITNKDAEVTLKVESDLVGGAKEQKVALKAKEKVTATVEIPSNVTVGSHEVKITATDADGREALKTVTVVVEDPKKASVAYDGEFDLGTISLNGAASGNQITWKSLETKIATVNGTKAKGVMPGNAGIIAYVGDDAVGAVLLSVGSDLTGTELTAGAAAYKVYVTSTVSANGKKHFEKGRGSEAKKKTYDVTVLVFRDGQLLAQSAYKTKFKKNKKAGIGTVTVKLAKSVGDKAEKKVVKKQKFSFTVK
ncbi:MAG: hypothetical protein K6G84_11510 [Lachnospiraceae bacterium]|nr:hypothetical protein [Lachnospiraceae bacterium]